MPTKQPVGDGGIWSFKDTFKDTVRVVEALDQRSCAHAWHQGKEGRNEKQTGSNHTPNIDREALASAALSLVGVRIIFRRCPLSQQRCCFQANANPECLKPPSGRQTSRYCGSARVQGQGTSDWHSLGQRCYAAKQE
eukprot:scaffold28686_cov18-Tisochrysis_lutea.AAC.3